MSDTQFGDDVFVPLGPVQMTRRRQEPDLAMGLVVGSLASLVSIWWMWDLLTAALVVMGLGGVLILKGCVEWYRA
jgi:hypothetical protein